jgi:hypothetical protein
LSLAPQLQTAFQAHPIRKPHATNTDREIKQGRRRRRRRRSAYIDCGLENAKFKISYPSTI